MAFIPENNMNFSTVEEERRRLLDYCLVLEEPILRLDLSRVQQCDSAGLALLIEAKRLARQHKKMCSIEGMTKAIRALAEFSGVDALLQDL